VWLLHLAAALLAVLAAKVTDPHQVAVLAWSCGDGAWRRSRPADRRHPGMLTVSFWWLLYGAGMLGFSNLYFLTDRSQLR
jgi:hypothetical protein